MEEFEKSEAAHQQVGKHYNHFPYPSYPLFFQGSWRDLSSVDCRQWGASREIRDIWIAGCGTTAPVAFGRRNYDARIIASDLSKKSLATAKRRLYLSGVHNVSLVCEDIALVNYKHEFDAVDAFGVIHHTSSPELCLNRLAQSLREGGILRCMLYNKQLRSEIENLREDCRQKGFGTPEEVRAYLIEKDFELEGDLSSRSGIADALLHPLVHTYNERELRDLFDSVESLEIKKIETPGNFIIFAVKTAD